MFSLLSTVQSIWPLTDCSFSVSRGCLKASQWASEEQLHGAEFSRSEPSPQHPRQPGLRGASKEERRPDGPGAGALGGRPGGWAVGGGWRLRCRTHRLSGHAGLRQKPMELHEPRSQIPTRSAASWWPHQIAPRPPAGQEAMALFTLFILELTCKRGKGGSIFSALWEEKKSGLLEGAAGKAVLTERNEFVFFIRFIILRNLAGFAVLISNFIYFSVYSRVLMWSGAGILSFHNSVRGTLWPFGC